MKTQKKILKINWHDQLRKIPDIPEEMAFMKEEIRMFFTENRKKYSCVIEDDCILEGDFDFCNLYH